MPIIVDYSAEVRPIPLASMLRRAGLLLQDEEHVRWTVPEMIEWINEGVYAIIRAMPAAGARRTAFTLRPGARQVMHGSDIQLLDVVCNLGAEGAAPGRAIRKIDRWLLDSSNPDWQGMPRSSTIRHYCYDDRSPTVFYVYPPAEQGTRVEMIRATLPDDVIAIDENIALSIEYADSLLNYLMFRCLSKDNEFANGNVAAAYFNAYTTSLTLGDTGEQSVSPTLKVPA